MKFAVTLLFPCMLSDFISWFFSTFVLLETKPIGFKEYEIAPALIPKVNDASGEPERGSRSTAASFVIFHWALGRSYQLNKRMKASLLIFRVLNRSKTEGEGESPSSVSV